MSLLKIKIHNEIYINLLALLFFFIVSIFYPLLSALFIFIFVAKNNRNHHCLKYSLLLLFIFFFSINLNKVIENDLLWYSGQYTLNLGAKYTDIFNVDRLGVVARASEPVYHSLSYLLSNLTNANYSLFVFSITFLIYYLTGYAIYKSLLSFKCSSATISITLLFHMLFGIVFTQSLHLVRQYIAGVFLLLFVILLIRSTSKLPVLFALLSCFTHNSIAILVILFLFIYKIMNLNFSLFYQYLYSTFCTIFLAFIYILSFFLMGEQGRLSKDDGTISTMVIAIDSLLFICCAIFVWFNRNILPSFLIKFHCYYFMLFLFCMVLNISLFLGLRYYFYLDFFRWVPFFIFIFSLKKNKVSNLFVSGLISLSGVIYLTARLNSSPFDFGYNIFEYIFYPIFIFF